MPNKYFTNVLAGSYIERAAHRRKDDEWLARAIDDPQSLFVPLWRAQNLLTTSANQLDAILIERRHSHYDELQASSSASIFLGMLRDRPCFAMLLNETEQPPQIEDAAFQDIRTLLGAMNREEAGLLAYARALASWREKHRYCGKCGSPTKATQAGHAMKCTSDVCALETFPRIDPAVIVLITDGDRALLGRNAAWRPGWYSTIAGFVEAGESLEDAVRREALEETGVQVDEVRYHSSQPWPFPQSLMLGFIAQAKTTEIVLSDDELEDARWFTRADIANGMPMTPPPVSISGCLIEEWYNSDAARPLREEPAARTWNTRRA